jgi:hypothetical protein
VLLLIDPPEVAEENGDDESDFDPFACSDKGENSINPRGQSDSSAFGATLGDT